MAVPIKFKKIVKWFFIALLILCLLFISGILIIYFEHRNYESHPARTQASMNVIGNALNNYRADCGHYPEVLLSLEKKDLSCEKWGPEPYMRKIPKDGWNRDFIYEKQGDKYVLKSLGYNGKEIIYESN